MANFVMSVLSVVDNAKEMMLSGTWTKALDYLQESLEGISSDECFELLKGEKSIVNDDLVDQEDTDYKNQLKEIYLQGFFDCNGVRYKYQEHFSLEYFENILSGGYKNDRYLREYGEQAYINKFLVLEGDKVFQVNNKIWIIAKEVSVNDTPFWYRKRDFPNNVKEMFFQLYPENSVVVAKNLEHLPENEQDVVEEEPKVKKYSALNKNLRKQVVEDFAKNEGFNSVKELEVSLREKILKSSKEQNLHWKEFKGSINGVDYVKQVPLELVLAYINKSNTHLWKSVSPSGVKMENDSPWHTDLWLALGFELAENEYEYDSLEFEIFDDILKTVEKMVLPENDFTVLSSQGLHHFEGNVVFENSSKITDKDILILPNANLKYEKIAKKAGLVIVEKGSQLSHLVIVGKQEALPVLKMEKALSIFKDVKKIKVDLDKKKIQFID